MITLAQTGWQFEKWANHTTLHPIGIAAAGLVAILVLCGSRRVAVAGFFLLLFFVSTSQRVVIGGMDFSFVRILVIAGAVRVLMRGELSSFRFRLQDGLILAFVLTTAIATIVRTGGEGTINRLGFSLDVLGLYFLSRCLVRSQDDLVWVLKIVVFPMILVVIFFFIERATGRNPFYIFGGVSEITDMRNGKMRCQGAFAHSIIAGVFFACLIPMFFGAYLSRVESRRIFLLGIFLSIGIIFTTSSSTPASAVLLGIVGWCAFPFRHSLSIVRWALLAIVLSLHFAMENGVWHVLARIDLVGGSTGWHRYILIDRGIAHFNEWYLIGTRSTGHWGVGLEDMTNQYLHAGVNGGILAMCLLVLTIATSFATVGKTLKSTNGKTNSRFVFGLGVSVFVHACVFISLSYFGQLDFLWYFTLAVIENIGQSAADPVANSGVARPSVPLPRNDRARARGVGVGFDSRSPAGWNST
jgi:hypothetical protein